MKKTSLIAVFSFCCAVSLTGSSPAVDYCKPDRIKLINDGWMFQDGQSSTDFLKNNIGMLEDKIPGHGISVRFIVPKKFCEGQYIETTRVFGKPRWKYEYFRHDIENLKNTKFRKFTDNFLSLCVNPGNADWFSDSQWELICNNFAIASRIAKETGMRGFKLDIEEYGKNKMWQFDPSKGRTREETHRMVRKRGQEFGKALFSSFPDARVLAYWWVSLARHKNDLYNPEKADYMVAPFVNGVYDVLPPQAVIYDGNETCAYRANSAREFNHLQVDMATRFPRFIARENMAKYRMQTRLAPGLYLDPHFHSRNNYWKNQLNPDLKELGGLRLFQRNLQQAMEVAEDYVWLWHERYDFADSKFKWGKLTSVESAVPGFTRMVDTVLNPEKYIEAALKTPNLLKNGDFSRGPEGKQPVACFAQWHGGKGKFERVKQDGNYVLAAKGVEDGCVYQSLRVKAGAMYLVRGAMSSASPAAKARGCIVVNWKRNDGERFADYVNRVYFFTPEKAGEMEKADFIVTVPEGADFMEIMLTVQGSVSGDALYFDNVEVFKILD